MSDVTGEGLTCPQCGGELHPDEGQIFLACPFCGSAVHADKSRIVFHWYLASTLDEAQAKAALARWMAGNQTVKDLDRKARLTGITFSYFPVWHIREKSSGREGAVLEPAAATSVTELKAVRLPAGDLRKYEASLDPQAVSPSIPFDTVLGWLAAQGVAREHIVEAALVHLPLYTAKYSYGGRIYTALVEAATGSVFANIFPAKAEAPYMAAAAATAGTFLCLALVPLGGYLSGDVEGLGLGLLICGGLGLVAAPLLFAFAAWVAARV
jgi:predicted RNA-binding Zn-ribbon protein involved in translation (DUF1610 family)